MKSEFIELVLTCEDRTEAEKIADALLDARLIACAKFAGIDSRYRWNDQIVNAQETLLLMETTADKFAAIEAEVTKLHSYETFVLKALPVGDISRAAAEWIRTVTDG